MESAHRGPLRIESQPSGCAVRLNGILFGQTPLETDHLAPGEYRVQVECGEVRGRVHRATIADASPVTMRIDARFDAAVHTDGALRLEYADADDAAAHLAADAASIGNVLGATEVWTVGVRTDGSLDGLRVRVEDGLVLTRVDGLAGGPTALVSALRAQPAIAVAHDVDPSGWIVLAGGGAVAIVGAILMGVGAPDLNAVAQPRDGETYRAATNRQSNAELLAGIGGAALGVGVIAASVGLGLALAGGHDDHASARLRIGLATLSLTVEY